MIALLEPLFVSYPHRCTCTGIVVIFGQGHEFKSGGIVCLGHIQLRAEAQTGWVCSSQVIMFFVPEKSSVINDYSVEQTRSTFAAFCNCHSLWENYLFYKVASFFAAYENFL